MREEFKNLPRFAEEKAKQENISGFLGSLNLAKTKDNKIADYADHFMFRNLYTACSQIIRNEDILSDRNIKTSIHTIVSSSSASSDLAYIAENIDGVMEAMRNQVTAYGNDGDFAKLTETAKAWENANKEVESFISKLKTIVDNNLEKGYGSRSQLRRLEYSKFEDKKPEIEKLFMDGKTSSEIAEQLKVKNGMVQNFTSELIGKKLDINLDKIKAQLESNNSRVAIATDLGVSKNRLNKFIAENNLVSSGKQIEKPVKTKEPIQDKADSTKAKPATAKPATVSKTVAA